MNERKKSKVTELLLKLEAIGLVGDDVTDGDIRRANSKLREVDALTGLKLQIERARKVRRR